MVKRYGDQILGRALCNIYLSTPQSRLEDFEIVRQGIIELLEIRKAFEFGEREKFTKKVGGQEVYGVWCHEYHKTQLSHCNWDELTQKEYRLVEEMSRIVLTRFIAAISDRIDEAQ